MVSALTRLALFSHRHPLALGMMSYAAVWPASSLIQQTIAGKNIRNYDWMQAARYCVLGSMVSAPALYVWLRFIRRVYPATGLKSSFIKAVIEQISFGPCHLATFFFGMSILEGKNIEQATLKVQAKFLPTWKIGACVWPFLTTINYTYVKERYRVPFVCCCSLVWICFLAYVHQQEQGNPRSMNNTK